MNNQIDWPRDVDFFAELGMAEDPEPLIQRAAGNLVFHRRGEQRLAMVGLALELTPDARALAQHLVDSGMMRTCGLYSYDLLNSPERMHSAVTRIRSGQQYLAHPGTPETQPGYLVGDLVRNETTLTEQLALLPLPAGGEGAWGPLPTAVELGRAAYLARLGVQQVSFDPATPWEYAVHVMGEHGRPELQFGSSLFTPWSQLRQILRV